MEDGEPDIPMGLAFRHGKALWSPKSPLRHLPDRPMHFFAHHWNRLVCRLFGHGYIIPPGGPEEDDWVCCDCSTYVGPPCLREEDDPALARLWDNPEDAAAYDDERDDPEDMLLVSLEGLEQWEAEHGLGQ